MFPTALAQTDITSAFPFLTIYLVIGFSFLLQQMRKILILMTTAMVLFFPTKSESYMYAPGGCGTSCMAQTLMWRQPQFWPGVYAYPYMPYPPYYYQSPYTMYPPWMSDCYNCQWTSGAGGSRIIQSIEKK